MRAVAFTELDFIGAVTHLMGRVGEMTVVSIGNTKRGSTEPPILASATGTLSIAEDEFDTMGEEAQPVGFRIGDLVLWLDPVYFTEAHVRDRYLALRFGEFEVEIHDPGE